MNIMPKDGLVGDPLLRLGKSSNQAVSDVKYYSSNLAALLPRLQATDLSVYGTKRIDRFLLFVLSSRNCEWRDIDVDIHTRIRVTYIMGCLSLPSSSFDRPQNGRTIR